MFDLVNKLTESKKVIKFISAHCNLVKLRQKELTLDLKKEKHVMQIKFQSFAKIAMGLSLQQRNFCLLLNRNNGCLLRQKGKVFLNDLIKEIELTTGTTFRNSPF